MKTALWAALVVLALEIVKWLFGVHISLTVAVVAMTFCVGALCMAGKRSDADGKGEG